MKLPGSGSERPALWTHSVEETEKDWTIVSGLETDVVYEMKIIARNGDSADSPKSTSRIGRVRTGSYRQCLIVTHSNHQLLAQSTVLALKAL